MTRRETAWRRWGALLASAAIVGASLAGCAAPSTDLSQGAAAAMQESVVSIAEAAAAGDPASALGRLDQLQQELAAALAGGDVTEERAAAIQAAIELVRADLQPAPVTDPAPSPVPETTTTTPADTGGGEDDAPPKDNSGPGNNNGNGNGNGSNGNGGKGKGNKGD